MLWLCVSLSCLNMQGSMYKHNALLFVALFHITRLIHHYMLGGQSITAVSCETWSKV